MRSLAWSSLSALTLVALAACGEVPQTFSDAGDGGGGGGDGGACSPTCAANATCTGTTCACNGGFTGDGLTCTDNNECTAGGNGGCDFNALCTNVPGSRTCACLPGFIGDGVTCRQSWMRVGTLADVNINPEGFGGKAAAVGAVIYFGPETNHLPNVFFRSFNTSTNQFSAPLALPPNPVTNPPDPNRVSSDFCACGLTDAFVADLSSVFMLGNVGYRYVVADNRWAEVTSYASPHQRGEAAGSYDRNNNLILLVGGRAVGTEVSAFNATRLAVSNLMFAPEGGTLPGEGADHARAWTLTGGNVTYIAGGRTGNNRTLIPHATGSGTWNTLAEAPQHLGDPTGMGEFMGKIWVSTSDRLFFYDPSTSAWRPTGLDAPSGFVLAVTATSGTYALAQNGTTLEVHKLMNIE